MIAIAGQNKQSVQWQKSSHNKSGLRTSLKQNHYIIGLIVLLIFAHVSCKQNPQPEQLAIQQLHSLFTEVEFDVLHTYVPGRVPAKFNATNLYPYKGVEIDSVLQLQIRQVIKVQADCRFFATQRFYITVRLEALLVRTYEDPEHHMHFLIYDNENNSIRRGPELAYAYGYEGSFGGQESWIVDLDKDGKKDILTRNWSELVKGDDTEIKTDSLWISVWKNDTLVSVGVPPSEFRKHLEEDFPYYQEPGLGFNTREELAVYMKEKAGITIPQYMENNKLCIIAGINNSLQAAKKDLEQLGNILGNDHKYDLDARLLTLCKIKNSYYTIVSSSFLTANHAAIALHEIQNIYNKNARLASFDTLCIHSRFNTEGFYECGAY